MRLFVMTGDFMSGKTTWLMHMLETAARKPLEIAGIITPAVFTEGKKVGIDALLLPGHERFGLARPRSGTFVDERGSTDMPARATRPSSPAPKHKSGWTFDAAAMNRINQHLSSPACARCNLLVIDELGPLELLHGKGYVEALRLLDEGIPHTALVVIRPALLDTARSRWGSFETLGPKSSAEDFLRQLQL